MISFIQSCSIDTTAYFSILTTIIIKVHKKNFQIINLSHTGCPMRWLTVATSNFRLPKLFANENEKCLFSQTHRSFT